MKAETKTYISRNWMKLLRIAGYIILALIAFFKLIAKKNVIPDYIEYGKDIAPGTGNTIPGIFSTVFQKAFSEFNSISPAFTTLVVILIVAILAICTLHMIMDKKPVKKK